MSAPAAKMCGRPDRKTTTLPRKRATADPSSRSASDDSRFIPPSSNTISSSVTVKRIGEGRHLMLGHRSAEADRRADQMHDRQQRDAADEKRDAGRFDHQFRGEERKER